MTKERTATEKERERLIMMWVSSWKEKNAEGFETVFASDIHYIRSWGPEYYGLLELKYWFNERNDRSTILEWDVDCFFHGENETITHWFLKDQPQHKTIKLIEGVSLIKWDDNNKIIYVQDFISNTHRSDPYKTSEFPNYTKQQLDWFDKLHK
ncbi:hypothetical protein [Lactobacillus sp. PV034]|uniref:hypothetical protein n=1 Tax=Lactobacillus sp. PV034 TaxID=2594495 RepID=UPI00223ED0D9|nr:hypothetical protein [Lactobacillus sp. PV034]QNQ81294.1 hypothetical protein FP432_06875 [Lactobacillus sp. PV034]